MAKPAPTPPMYGIKPAPGGKAMPGILTRTFAQMLEPVIDEIERRRGRLDSVARQYVIVPYADYMDLLRQLDRLRSTAGRPGPQTPVVRRPMDGDAA